MKLELMNLISSTQFKQLCPVDLTPFGSLQPKETETSPLTPGPTQDLHPPGPQEEVTALPWCRYPYA